MAYGNAMGTDRLILNIPAIYEMYQNGHSLRALGRLLHVSATALKARFDREHLPMERYHRKVPLRRLAELHAQGLNQSEMARRLHVSKTLVFRGMERLRARYPEHASMKRQSSRYHRPSHHVALYIQPSMNPLPIPLGVMTGLWAHLCSDSLPCSWIVQACEWAALAPRVDTREVE